MGTHETRYSHDALHRPWTSPALVSKGAHDRDQGMGPFWLQPKVSVGLFAFS